MAKVNAPLFSLDARGQLGKAIVYSFWKGVQVVRRYIVPANPDTADQQKIRGEFQDAVDRWQALSADQKSDWDDYVG